MLSLLKPSYYLLLMLLLLAVAQLCHVYIADLALIRADISRGQWWRLLSGQWVHSNAYHFVSNSVVFSCLSLLDHRAARRKAAEFVALSGVCGAMVYLFCSALDYYLGLSGVLHGYLLLILLSMRRDKPMLAYAGVAVLLGKLLLEQCDLYPRAATEELIGLRVAIEAHLAGAASAVIVFVSELIYSAYKRR